MDPAILWLRNDLRLSDNPALDAALASGRPVLPLFVWDGQGEGDWPLGGASQSWLHHSLTALSRSLEERGSRLILRRGRSIEVIKGLLAETGARGVYWNRRYEPAVISRDTEIKRFLQGECLEARSFNGSLLQSPTSVRNKSGRPFRVFTPFWKCIQGMDMERPLSEPGDMPAPKSWPGSDSLADWELRPRIAWDAGFYRVWDPGEKGASSRLEALAARPRGSYSENRDLPAVDAVSRLSPHLHFGEISPRQVWHRLKGKSHEAFLRQLAWREFSTHLLYHFPETAREPLRPEFAAFPWKRDEKALQAWRRGRTGYPIVDAGMRELWTTGWMHNRVRMVAASFLVKHLLQHWQEGARWFWDTLVDADLPNNTMGWQWVAGCGADAAPYFRVFNPMSQGERFDASGEYTRKWVPELARLPDCFLFRPWEAPEEVLDGAGVALGSDYPLPIVEHQSGRQAALSAYRKMREGLD